MPGQNGMLSVQLTDDSGVTASHNIFLYVDDDAQAISTIVTTVQSYLAVLDAVTDAKITGAGFTLNVDLPAGLKATAVADSNVEETFLANFSQEGFVYKYGIDVPAASQAMITNGKIDLSNIDFAAWRTWIVSIHGHWQVLSKFLNAITGLLDVLITFRKHRKAQTRRSIVTG